MNRRHALKRMFMIGGCAFIAPSVSLERLAYANFVPGELYRNGFWSVINPDFACELYSDEWERRQNIIEINGVRSIENWFKQIIPTNFLDIKKIRYQSKMFDYNRLIAIAGFYQSPRKPIK